MQKIKICLLLSIFFIAAVSIFVFASRRVSAQNQCQYGSTQARVQRDITDPWKPELTITKGEGFNVGSFHDGTGQFANDTQLRVTGPQLDFNYQNSQQVFPPQSGTYTLTVTTRNQTGGGCTEQARVTVVEQQNNQFCPYGNTQARVQRDINDPWKPELSLNCGQTFNVGSFHNQTGQFANDTRLAVIDPQGNERIFTNGQAVSTDRAGEYRLKVTTPGKQSAACEADAVVHVTCPAPSPTPTRTPTPTTTPPTEACQYGSTQARVQVNDQFEWTQQLDLHCFDSFRVGAFHDGTGQLANDASIQVLGPAGLSTFSNGQTVNIVHPGIYTVYARTNGRHGLACEDAAQVKVSCP